MWNTGVLLVIHCFISGNFGDSTDRSNGKSASLPLSIHSVGRVYDLEVEHVNPNKIFVTWKYDPPLNVVKAYISFSIKLRSPVSFRIRKLQYPDLTTETYFDNLRVNTRYSVKVEAIYNPFGDTPLPFSRWKSRDGSRTIEFVTWDGVSPKLDTPANLVAVNLNPTDVQLEWTFDKPVNVTSEEVLFFVQIEEKAKPEPRPLLSTPRTALMIRELDRDTNYTVTIWASHPECGDSLGLHGTFSTTTPGGVALSPPTDLRVGHKDTRTVWISWDFPNPDNLRMHDVQFVVQFASLNTSSRPNYRVVSKSRPIRRLRYKLSGLEENTTYTVRIQAFHPKRSDSAPLGGNFTTMASNWSAPHVTGVTRDQDNDTAEFANFDVQWNVKKSSGLRKFVLRIRPSTGTRREFGPDERSGKILVPYEKPFAVSVTVYYEQPIIGSIKVHSTHIEHGGAVGKPSEVRNFTGMALGSKIQLQWEPPKIQRGPLTHYTVGVYDSSPLVYYALSKFDTKETVISIDAPPLLGSEYVVKVWAVNVDETHFTSREKFLGYPNEIGIPSYRPPPPSIMNIRSGQNDAEFSFSLNERQPDTEYFFHYQTDYGFSRTSLYGTGRIDGLSPGKKFNLTARTCFYYPNTGNLLMSCGCSCGAYTVLTAAAPPSRVLDLHVLWAPEGFVIISWEEPESSNGRLDGYLISIVESGHTLPYITVDRNTRQYAFQGVKKGLKYIFGVAAFNYDLRTGEKVKAVGQFRWDDGIEDEPIQYSPDPHYKLLMWLFFLILLSTCLVILCYLCRN